MIQIISAARASTPYPWAKFARWMAEQGLSAEEYQIMLENGAEPVADLVMGTIDQSVTYPGLPALEGMSLNGEEVGSHDIHAVGGSLT